MRTGLVVLFLLTMTLGFRLSGKEIVVGVNPIPKKDFGFSLTPIVIPDLISAKFAFEIKVHKHLNLVIPLEAKWMDYRWAIRLLMKTLGSDNYRDYPQKWSNPNQRLQLDWDMDFSQLKVSMGAGVRWFPFSEAMEESAFFIKTLGLVGVAHFKTYLDNQTHDSAVFTHVLTVGYRWINSRILTFDLELGEETKWYTNPTKGLPTVFFDGIIPMFQFSMGFTI